MLNMMKEIVTHLTTIILILNRQPEDGRITG